jgi:hypothetical protein
MRCIGTQYGAQTLGGLSTHRRQAGIDGIGSLKAVHVHVPHHIFTVLFCFNGNFENRGQRICLNSCPTCKFPSLMFPILHFSPYIYKRVCEDGGHRVLMDRSMDCGAGRGACPSPRSSTCACPLVVHLRVMMLRVVLGLW